MDAATNQRLRYFDALPDGFIEARPAQLPEILGGPALISVAGHSDRTLFVSFLLHGNETTGLYAVQNLLREFDGDPPRHSLLLLAGNVPAAAHGLRSLDGQADFNRVWPDENGTGGAQTGAVAELVTGVLDRLRQTPLIGAVDIHNNSGRNPAHACITSTEGRHVALAAAFSPLLLYYRYPAGTLAQALLGYCPVTTIECGMPGDIDIQQRAQRYLARLLEQGVPAHAPAREAPVRILRNAASVNVQPATRIGSLPDGADIEFPVDLDRWNWREMPRGELIASVRDGNRPPLRVTSADGANITDRTMRLQDDRLISARPLIPAMISLDTRIISQDCLCYLLEPVFKPLSSGK